MVKKIIFSLIFNLVFCSVSFSLLAKEKILSSEHFIIYYDEGIYFDYVRKVKEKAEEYYRKISQEFNLIREELWLWEKRAKIFIARDRESFKKKFNCPEWSSACVQYESKKIFTYFQQRNFFLILAHELTHIIFREYIGRGRAPLWLDEGVAVFMETKYGASSGYSLSQIRKIIEEKKYIPFFQMDKIYSLKGTEHKNNEVDIFYLQAYSMVYFLYTRFGRSNFSTFLYYLHNGRGFQDAFRKAFSSLRDIASFENKWKRYFSNL